MTTLAARADAGDWSARDRLVALLAARGDAGDVASLRGLVHQGTPGAAEALVGLLLRQAGLPPATRAGLDVSGELVMAGGP